MSSGVFALLIVYNIGQQVAPLLCLHPYSWAVEKTGYSQFHKYYCDSNVAVACIKICSSTVCGRLYAVSGDFWGEKARRPEVFIHMPSRNMHPGGTKWLTFVMVVLRWLCHPLTVQCVEHLFCHRGLISMPWHMTHTVAFLLTALDIKITVSAYVTKSGIPPGFY